MLGRTFAVLPSWQFLRPKTTISNFVWNFEKILNFFIAFKKIIKIGPTCFKDHSALKLKKHRNFATFKFFSLRCEIELVPQNINKLHWNKWSFFLFWSHKTNRFFLRLLIFALYLILWKLAILQNGVKKFNFPN